MIEGTNIVDAVVHCSVGCQLLIDHCVSSLREHFALVLPGGVSEPCALQSRSLPTCGFINCAGKHRGEMIPEIPIMEVLKQCNFQPACYTWVRHMSDTNLRHVQLLRSDKARACCTNVRPQSLRRQAS